MFCFTFICLLACSQSLNSSSGFIVSPFYPGYYTNNMTCTWHVTAKENHVIHLHFQSFAIENHPTCANDYVEVRDGGSHRSRTLGKYCGHTVPPFIESSSNVLTIVFSTNDVNTRTGFKAYYHTKPGEIWTMFTASHPSINIILRRYFFWLKVFKLKKKSKLVIKSTSFDFFFWTGPRHRKLTESSVSKEFQGTSMHRR